MRIQFDPNLDYQAEAITSIVDIFEGQQICQTNFTVAPLSVPKTDDQEVMEFGSDLGIGNRLRLLDEDILHSPANTESTGKGMLPLLS